MTLANGIRFVLVSRVFEPPASGPWALRSRKVVLPHDVAPACLTIENGVISSVAPHDAPCTVHTVDVGETVVMPGLVDTHVHLNEPGRTDWEGFVTGTRAAIAGGVTTLIDMPLNCTPVTTTVAALDIKRAETTGKLWSDVGFWGGVVPEHLNALPALARAGVFGCKAFMVHSGIDDFPATGLEELEHAMVVLAKAGIPLLAHAELETPVTIVEPDPRKYAHYLQSRPKKWEDDAIAALIERCRRTRCRTHIVHLSSASALPLIAHAKAEGLPLTVETCPHYLCLSAQDVPDGATLWKCAPPIRERTNQDALWEGLRAGIIDFVTSDHSPCTPHLKHEDTGNFDEAWGGIASLQLALGNLWHAAQPRGFTMANLYRWLSHGPAQFLGLPRKGQLVPGADADIVVWDPLPNDRLEQQSLHFRHKHSPYVGREHGGRIRATYLAGELAFADGAHVGVPRGRMLSASV